MSQEGALMESSQQPKILVTSGGSVERPNHNFQQLDPAFQKYVRSESKPSVSSFKNVPRQHDYMTISKGEQSFVDNLHDDTFREMNSSVAVGFPRNDKMSNFSAQYRNFKSQRKGKVSDRRNINAGGTG